MTLDVRSDQRRNRIGASAVLALWLCFATLPLTRQAFAGVWETSNGAIDVQALYVSYYGRPADPPGYSYWTRRLARVSNLGPVLEAFGASPEFNAIYGSLGSTELINSLYQQMFGRQADPGGLRFYKRRLDADLLSPITIAGRIANAARGSDVTNLGLKVAVANEFTNSIFQGFSPGLYNARHVPTLRNLLAKVDQDGARSLAEAYNAVAQDWERDSSRQSLIQQAQSFLDGTEAICEIVSAADDPARALSCMSLALSQRRSFVAYEAANDPDRTITGAIVYDGMQDQAVALYLNEQECPFAITLCSYEVTAEVFSDVTTHFRP